MCTLNVPLRVTQTPSDISVRREKVRTEIFSIFREGGGAEGKEKM